MPLKEPSPKGLRSRIVRKVKVINTYCTPVFLIPLLTKGTKEAKCAYGLFLMFSCWIFDTIPTAIASSLPFVLLPVLGIMAPDDVALQYLSNIFLFILSVMLISVAIETTNLYTRITLIMLSRLGAGVKSVFTGILALSFLMTFFLTSGTATLFAFPIVESTIVEIEHDTMTNSQRRRMRRRASVQARINLRKGEDSAPPVSPVVPSRPVGTEHRPSRVLSFSTADASEVGIYGLQRRASVVSEEFATKFEKEFQKYKLIREALLLSVVYCTTLGGIGALYGNSSSRTLFSYLEERYAYKNFSFFSWFCLCAPVSAASVFTCWIVIFEFFLKEYDCEEDEETKESISKILEDKCHSLGSITKSEVFVVTMTVLLFLLLRVRSTSVVWFGWQDFFAVLFVNDTSCIFFVVLLFFALPQNPRRYMFEDYVLEWAVVQHKIPWNVFLTYGGGLCMAAAVEKSGLSLWMLGAVDFMKGWNPVVVQLVLTLVTAMLTEVQSDVATASFLIPIACDLADSSLVNPLYYTFPVTAASCTGMLLPVASVPMALAYGTLDEYEKTKVVVPVLIMKMVTVLSAFISVHVTGCYYYSFCSYPSWANRTENKTNALQ